MRSKWIEFAGKRIFYQDFSNLGMDSTEAVKAELAEVQAVVLSQPEDSLLVLSDFRNTSINNELMGILRESSAKTKGHIRKTAVLGVVGVKRVLADILTKLTGQKLSYFEHESDAKAWLVRSDTN
ncbi:MAG: hypothetical protein WHV44_11380 [Anaerolineales bacterium]